jgi:DNA polymerase-4/DNA polymerase V
MDHPLSLRSFPRAILHIDGDSFFASCEQALHTELRGKPLVTGKERGIASAVSKEAKALGVKRGMSMREIRTLCPDIVHVPSDYETYSIFSCRMYAIVRRYTSLVEEYGIDECFAEITGLRRPLRKSYAEIAAMIKDDLERELGMTFSIGLAPSKVTAKIGSKWNKPSGLVVMPGTKLHLFLKDLPVEKVWGIGEQTTAHMRSLGIITALDFVRHDRAWVAKTFTKPHQDIWHELQGTAVIPLETKQKSTYGSISKAKTFTPPSAESGRILSELSKNIENACIKARRHSLAARKILFFLLTQEYARSGYEIRLAYPTNDPATIVAAIQKHLPALMARGALYRQTCVVLADLIPDTVRQGDLFGVADREESVRAIYAELDTLTKKYGKHTVFLGSSFIAMTRGQHKGERSDIPRRKSDLFRGETARKRIGIPLLGDVE